MNVVVKEHHEPHLRLSNYIVGFVGCVALTLVAYLLVTQQAGSTGTLVGLLSGLALAQFLVQMVLFLHIGDEKQPRWKLMALLFMTGIVLIVVVGSVWIMNNLNYRMMDSPQKQTEYLKSQDSI
jgi:cytochrome o ubiquinol oxidase operon protein cyoD